MAKCSTLTERFRYTSDTVFDTFPWPQFAMGSATVSVAESGVAPDSRPTKISPAKMSDERSFRRDAENRRRDARAPQKEIEKIRAVAEAARALRNLRHEIMQDNGWSLRELYKSLETPGENRLRTAHAALDAAVRAAYGMKPAEDILAFLLKLNLELADKEAKGETITPPGLPAFVKDPKTFISKDCVSVDLPKEKEKPLYAQKVPKGKGTLESEAAAAKYYSIHEEPTPYGKNKN
jgi:hypothetical protein